jgi:hypothetical protein
MAARHAIENMEAELDIGPRSFFVGPVLMGHDSLRALLKGDEERLWEEVKSWTEDIPFIPEGEVPDDEEEVLVRYYEGLYEDPAYEEDKQGKQLEARVRKAIDRLAKGPDERWAREHNIKDLKRTIDAVLPPAFDAPYGNPEVHHR